MGRWMSLRKLLVMRKRQDPGPGRSFSLYTISNWLPGGFFWSAMAERSCWQSLQIPLF